MLNRYNMRKTTSFWLGLYFKKYSYKKGMNAFEAFKSLWYVTKGNAPEREL